MPLRKKHVRRIVAGLLFVLVLAPLAVLAALALGLRGDAYSNAMAAELSARLHCDAAVHGARPTGPGTAAAETVELVWQIGAGRVAFQLDDLVATRDATSAWRLTARSGQVAVKSDNLRETLQALNQRLVQPADDQPPITLAETPFTVAIESDLVTTRETGEFRLNKGHVTPFEATFRRSTSAGRISVGIHLDPRSPAGAFQMLGARLDNLPVDRFGRCLLGPKPPATLAGTARVDITWGRAGWQQPPQNSDAFRHIVLNAKDLDLSQWTGSLPGGPMHGAATLSLTYVDDNDGPPQTIVAISARDGDIHPDTLRWLEGLGAGLKAPGSASNRPVTFDRLFARCNIEAGCGQFDGTRDLGGMIPLATTRLFGSEVPLLTATGRPFDAEMFWAILARALASGKAESRK
jgi:hypothetical protein